MKIIILSLLVCSAVAWGPGYDGYRSGLYKRVESHYGNTAFAYNDGDSTRREHIRADGTVEGSYTVVDPNGNKRTINYKAGPNGFEVDGDTGVDKATAEAAAENAANAPEAPEAPEVVLPVAPEVPEAPEVELPEAPTNPPDYGKRNEEVYKARKSAYGRRAYTPYGGYYGGHHSGYYGGHGYGYKTPLVKVVKVEEPKPASYGHGYSYGAPLAYGYRYGHGAPVVKVEEKKEEVKKPALYGHGYSYGAPLAYGYRYGHGAPVVKAEEKKEVKAYGYGAGYGYGGYGGYGYGGYGRRYDSGLFQKVESHYGNTAFAYNDGGSTRNEHIRADGTVEGSYTVVDANGNKRTVNYKAGPNGFEVDGDTGVDKATAEAAAEIAAQAPEAPVVEEVELPQAPEVPEVPDVELPVAPTNAPDYGKRNKEVYKIRKAAYGHGHYGTGYGYHGRPYGAYGYGYAAPKSVKPVKYGHYWH